MKKAFDSLIDNLSQQFVKEETAGELFDRSLERSYNKALDRPVRELTESLADTEYFEVNAYSSTLMKLYMTNPDLYRENNGKHPKYEMKQTASKKMGSIIHRIILEGYSIESFKSILSARELDILDKVLHNIIRNEYIMNILKDVDVFEEPIYWKYPLNDKRLSCKAKIDLVTKSGCLFELKTCKDLGEEDFRKTIDKYRYDFQLSFYSDGWEKLSGNKLDAVGIIAIETEPPYGCHVYNLTQRFLARGKHGGHNLYKQPIAGWEDILEEIHFNPTGRFSNYYTILDL